MILRRTILKHDLVKKLYPDSISIRSAMELLRIELNLSSEVKKKLLELGSNQKHYYNNKQLQLILNHFSITDEEFENF